MIFSMKIPLIFFFGLLFTSVYCQPEIPDQAGYWVHDEAKVLSAQGKARLEAMVLAEEYATSNQIGVLIIKSLDGGSHRSYKLHN